MAAMMRRMGVEMRDIDDVKEVLIRTPTKEYVFTKASVSVMKAQGQETWQVVGTPKVRDATPASPTAPAAPVPSAAKATASPPASTVPGAVSTPSSPDQAASFTEEDVRLVMQQAHVDQTTARDALAATNGDLAEAILRLS